MYSVTPVSYQAGAWDVPHFHTGDARLYVIDGMLELDMGASFDRHNTTSYPKGSFIFVPKNAIHYDGAKEDTLILGVAQGPWKTHYVERK